jgi:prepilin-type N-terminal cleavage/methylation domain-containing protein/prepilin-type processing-associated H-X9-DG protein
MKMSNPISSAGISSRREGFTLIELLVVVAVVGILAGLLLPALVRARVKGESILCGSNQRQLIFAWMLYPDDHDGKLPNNFGSGDTKKTIEEGAYLNWVNNVMSWNLEPENTNATLIAAGGLGPYVSGSARIFRCPADYVLHDIQRSAGWTARTRSISMNAMVGDAGEFTRNGSNTNNPYFQQFFKMSEIDDPARIFVFIEEHPDSINDGYFLNKPYSSEWHDLPASYHNGAANLAFADGHVETRRWRFPSTKPRAAPDAAQLPFDVPAAEFGDFQWLMDRTSRKRYYNSSY